MVVPNFPGRIVRLEGIDFLYYAAALTETARLELLIH